MANPINCFVEKCRRLFDTTESYIFHLKNEHGVPNNHNFICTVPKCGQIFTKCYSFKRHVTNYFTSPQQRSIKRKAEPQECEIIEVNPVTSIENSSKQIPGQRLTNKLAEVDKQIVTFSLGLHKRPNLSRNDVSEIQKRTQDLYINIAHKIEQLRLVPADAESKYEFYHYIKKLKTAFDFIGTEHKLFNFIEETNLFRKPQIILIDNSENKEVPETYMKKSFLILMPVQFQIKAFFETKDVLEQTIKNIEKLEQSNKISNIVNGRIWKNIKEKYKNEYVIPITFYSDEFEINDPLSSHNKRHAVCGLYYSFPVLPPEFGSKLCNVFVAGMIKKIDFNDVGINKLIDKLIDTFIDLEEKGLQIESNGKIFKIRFSLCLMLGDNLGLHTMLLLSGGFSANYYCRFCRRSKCEMQNDEHEYSQCLRNGENYIEDIQLANQTETGIKGFSIFNKLPSFSVVQNLSVDPMHDFFSTGVCKYGLTEVVNYCVFIKKYATLAEVNSRRKIVSINDMDQALTRMPDLEDTYITAKKSKSVVIRTTASEMRSLCHFITFILGPFFPHDDPVWNYCKTLVRLVDISLQPTFSETDLERLQEAIAKHHKLYKQLFSETLKPKHHFLLHYPLVIRQSGPVLNMMCFRYEAKHKEYKQYANIISSRRNICYTLCLKASLQFSYDLSTEAFFQFAIEGDFITTRLTTRSYFKSLLYPIPFETKCEISISHACKYKGTTYKTGLFLTCTELHVTELYEIYEMIKTNDKMYIVGQLWQCGQYDEHLLAYESIRCTGLKKILLVDHFDGPPISIHCINNRAYFRKRYDFCQEDCDV